MKFLLLLLSLLVLGSCATVPNCALLQDQERLNCEAQQKYRVNNLDRANQFGGSRYR